ncbi:MAG: hypothetical protein CL910_20615 [Deltaproteobacteria bacterium]|jgi:hypothetical protein|nr:hypothetical protein [Deltaproteobacteria bacterium]
MADSPAFDFVCTQLEERTDLDRLATRGTVRLALKQAGLEARTITADQMKVVLEKVLPGELSARGIDGGADLCVQLKAGLAGIERGSEPETPDAVFRRLGGS